MEVCRLCISRPAEAPGDPAFPGATVVSGTVASGTVGLVVGLARFLFLVTALVALLDVGSLDAQGPPGGRPPGGGGRPLRVDGQQPLAFGELLAGIASTVAPTDPLNAARIRISGQGGADVLVSFLLPTALNGPGGATVPLMFGAGAAGYSPSEDIGAQVSFDPSLPNVFGLPQNGRGALFLGGTAMPPAQAPAGAYMATITLTISYVGN